MPSGYHMLVTTDSPKPTFIYKSLKRAGRMAARSFGDLKAVYDFRCVTCGSQEGKPHLLEADKRTVLQQGHMNPLKPLTLTNTIPQCQVCNQVYQDRFVFNEKGRVAAVASLEPIKNADAAVKQQILEYLSGAGGVLLSADLKTIADAYVARYAEQHGLARPLTPEQIKDATMELMGIIERAEFGLLE